MLINQFNKLNINYDVADDTEHSNLDDFNDGMSLEDAKFERVIDRLDILFLDRYDRSLATVEFLILKGIWQSQTYSEIAKESNYSPDYFTNVAAPKLLKKLSELVGSRITKKSCRSSITKYLMQGTLNRTQHYGLKKRDNLNSKDVFPVREFSWKKQVDFSDSFLRDAICFAQII